MHAARIYSVSECPVELRERVGALFLVLCLRCSNTKTQRQTDKQTDTLTGRAPDCTERASQAMAISARSRLACHALEPWQPVSCKHRENCLKGETNYLVNRVPLSRQALAGPLLEMRILEPKELGSPLK